MQGFKSKATIVLFGCAALLAFAFAGCGSSGEKREDRVEAGMSGDGACPVAIAGTTVRVRQMPQSAVYLFTTAEEGDIEKVRERVQAMTEEFNSVRKVEYRGKYGPGQSSAHFSSFVTAASEPIPEGAQMVLEIPDAKLAPHLREYVNNHMQQLRSGVCPAPDTIEDAAR